MRHLNIFHFMLVSAVVGLEQNVVDFSIDYFNYRRVKFVCMLTCERMNYWSHKFVKQASKQQIAVSKVNIDDELHNPFKLQKCFSQMYTSVGILVDSKCSGYETVMKFASSSAMFNSEHKWLIIDDGSQNMETKNDTGFYDDNITIAFNSSKAIVTVENVNTSVNSDIILGFCKGKKENLDYGFYEAFNFGKVQGGNLTVKFVGTWNNISGLNMIRNLNSYKYYDRWDFRQWAMRMILVYPPSLLKPQEQFKPEMVIGNVAPPVAVMVQTISMAALHVVAERHNFRYIYSLADRWIGVYEPADKTSVSSSLYHGYQDISPVVRSSYIDYGKIDTTHPPMDSIETKYYYRIPTHGTGKFENQFFRPLTTGSWICVLIVIALCALTLLLSAKLEQRQMPVQYAAFSVVASFSQQFFEDSEDHIKRRLSQARQIAIFVTGLFCVLIYNYYTSSVVSWLLNGPPPSINSLQELLDSSLQLIYEDVGYTKSWLQTPGYYFNSKNAKIEDMMRQKVLNKKKDATIFLPADEGIEMVKAGGYAFHTAVNTANMFISQKFNQMELCELGSLQSMEKSLLAPAIQINSPFKEFLVWSTARLSERGIVSCIQHRNRSPKVSCVGSSPRALALGGAAPAFMLLAFGYLLAICILLLERIVYRRKGPKI